MRLAFGKSWYGAENVFTTADGRIMNPATGPKWFSSFFSYKCFSSYSFS